MSRKSNSILQIGITGGIGSGKSLICAIFHTLGIPVYDADLRARWILNNNSTLREEIIKAFGDESYTEENQLNRKYLAAQVFNNSDKVTLLNSLVHPNVGKDYENWVKAHQSYPYLVKEAALMFESSSYQALDKIITVYAPVELRIKRIQRRDTHRSEQEIRAIIGKQLPEEEKVQRADFVIYNDDKQVVIPQVLALHKQFMDFSFGN